MKISVKFLIALALFLALIGLANKAKADVGPPSNQTTFHFQKNGQPFTRAIKLSIKCYGTSAMDNTDKLLEISDFSGTCQTYGCKFDISNTFEVYRQKTKYCDLEGEISGEKFTINNFLGDNLSGLNCHPQDMYIADVVSGKQMYYGTTPAFEECQSNVYREYYPSGNGKQVGDYICNKYLANLTPSPMEECIRYTHEIKNDGKCYIMPKEFPACGNEMYNKIKLCQKEYLEDITNKILKDKNGNAFGKICEVKVNIPDNIAVHTVDQQSKDIEVSSPTTSTEPLKSKGIFNRIGSFFKCNFLKLFGKSC